MRVGFVPSLRSVLIAAAALGLGWPTSSRADPIVQFVSNHTGYDAVQEWDPTAFGSQQGNTQQIIHTQVSAPTNQANWSSSGSTGGAGSSVTDNSVSVSASAGPAPLPSQVGNIYAVYDYVDSASGSVTFQLLTEAQATLGGGAFHGHVSVGPLYYDNYSGSAQSSNLSAILEPGTYTLSTLLNGYGSGPIALGTVTFTPTPEPASLALVGGLAAMGLCRLRPRRRPSDDHAAVEQPCPTARVIS